MATPNNVLLTLAAVTISSGGTASTGFATGGYPIVAVGMPGAWTAAGLSLQGSFDDSTYAALKDAYGNEITATVAASTVVQLDPTTALGVPYVKLVSGTNASAVTQAGDRSITVAFKVM